MTTENHGDPALNLTAGEPVGYTAHMRKALTVSRIAVATVLLLVLVASAQAQPPPPSGLCPPGDSETFNVNKPGCTFCFAPTDCSVQCLGPPACFCEPGDSRCCADKPCCFNCPEPMPLRCETSTCVCEPGSCCSTVCPDPAPAPASSAGGLAVLATVLAAFGIGAVRVATRRRAN